MGFSVSSVNFDVVVWKEIYSKDAILLQFFYDVEVMKKCVTLIDGNWEFKFSPKYAIAAQTRFWIRGGPYRLVISLCSYLVF